MTLTTSQTFLIAIMFAIGSMATRFLPFILLKGKKSQNSYITYLGQALPYAAIGMLVVYCLKDVNFSVPSYGTPEAIAILCIGFLHYWKGNTLVSIGVGTVLYMVLVQVVFI